MKQIVRSLIAPCLACSLVSGAAIGKNQEAAPRSTRSIGDAAEIKLIEKMEDDRVQAGVRKDVAKIAAATADEYLQIDFNGDIRDKSAAMERIKSSVFQLQSNSLDERSFGSSATRPSSQRGRPQKALSTAKTLASSCDTAAYTSSATAVGR
jgi:hypothetical protein